MSSEEMNSQTVTADPPRPTPYPSPQGWLSFDNAPSAGLAGSAAAGRKSLITAAALLLVGALCGALITLALRGSCLIA